MALRYPIEYELTPKNIQGGRRWMSLRLKNVSSDTLTALDVRLNSLDVYSISVYGTGSYVSVLEPEEEVVLPFQLQANSSGSLYISTDGFRDGVSFHWETPAVPITVGAEVAEIVSVFAMTEPYPLLGDRIECEATLRGLQETEGVTLEFWAENPSLDFEAFHTIETKALSPGETVRYSAEFEPEEKGLYTIYAYLYDGARRIGREIEHVSVREA
jgi:hypothetical protein